EEVAHLAASPHFVSNLRTPLGSDYDPNHLFAVMLSKDYTRAATYLGDTAAATDALSTTLLLFRCDPEAEIQFQALDQVLVTTLYLYELTTNSLALTDILHSLNNAR